MDDRELHVRGEEGPARLIDSSARQALRGTMGGAPAFWSVLAGTPSAELQTKKARSRVTRPRTRYSIRFDGPTHQGLPSRQERVRARSAESPFG